ncbi:MAG: glucoamylase family protein [Ilumatobacteraceae bacterium]
MRRLRGTIGAGASADGLEEPIVAELFSVERLEHHARTLAADQTVRPSSYRGERIRPRVADNGRVLENAYRVLAQAIREERSITPAAEWLVDNFSIVDEQLREIRDDLPPDYYRELPKLAGGHLDGYPRVFALAWAYVAHTDSRFDPDSLERMVRAYQEVEVLAIGELWAIAISLRLVLVENLRRLAERIIRAREDRQVADELADRVLGLSGERSNGTSSVVDPRVLTDLSAAGRVQLFQRLRDQDPSVTPMLHSLEELLAAHGTNAEDMVHAQHQRMATMNVTVRNVITSMRLISWFDWSEFVEKVGLVDEVLRQGGDFAELDFVTRNLYRNAVEQLSRGSGRAERYVAQRAVAMAAANDNRADASPNASRNPGYYLISDGRPELERDLEFRAPAVQRLRRALIRAGKRLYFGSILSLTAAGIAGVFAASGDGGAGAVVVGVLAITPASELAVSLVNRAVTRWLRPLPLPRLDLDGGVPPEMRTLVAVPTLLTSLSDIDAQVSGLEVHYLANQEGDIVFALLTDWLDADAEHVEGDDELLGHASAGIDRLNDRYGPTLEGGTRFLLLHRCRRWNAAEGCWMGWERKRGKLEELNSLLRGSSETSFRVVPNRPATEPRSGVRYVVTLDADTRLPRGAVGKLVGTLAHPLNRPQFDPRSRRVTHGYGLLQPRVTPTLPTAEEASIFQRAFAGAAGVDPYASAVSDVYQDLFQEGSYTGKGIYDVDAFAAAMHGRVPENTMLSHDLFEGVFARAGLVTDVELFDEFPSNYLVAAARQHRWARGDWQLLPWIVGLRHADVPERARSGIGSVGRWKMLDNLRRSLIAPLAVATLFTSWTIPSVSASWWTALVVLSVVIPTAMPIILGLRPQRQGISKRSHFRDIAGDGVVALDEVFLVISLLAHQAWLMVDAIVRTLGRVLITRRHLLEWRTAAQTAANSDVRLRGFFRQMLGGTWLAGLGVVLVALTKPGEFRVAGPFLALWLAAPLIAQRASRMPAVSGPEALEPIQIAKMRLVARRTWSFFETFVGEDDHWLPPDNFQDDPSPVVATRTSPTNIGMYLLAVITAHDFGWIGTIEMVRRLEATLATVGQLEMFHGHLYNWYDTRTLQRLDPEYVSTVDSGNLCGHLVSVSNACLDLIDQPLQITAAIAGIDDAVALVRESVLKFGKDVRGQTLTVDHLVDCLESIADLQRMPVAASNWAGRLDQLSSRAAILVDVASTLTAERGDPTDSELVVWAEAVQSTVRSHRADLTVLLSAGHSDHGRSPVNLSELDDVAPPAGPSASAVTLVRRLQAVSDDARRLFSAMDFTFLFDPVRKLFSIGFRVADGSLDPSYYDLLASEARLTSFIAIAKGDVDADHWFRLGRSLTPVGRGSALISWSGSMFEYLMPNLVMRAPIGSLLEQTARLIVARQMRYATDLGVPWGISESGYNARDLSQTYQYSGFGVPGLGLKRGLGEDLVISPYATGLAAMIDPGAAVRNFHRLGELCAIGRYGFREALDFTARRLPDNASVAVVNSYMAHHQGMLLVAIGNVVNDFAMVERFHAEPIVKATELLLHERMPRNALVARPRAEEVKSAADVRDTVPPMLRRFTSPHDAIPRSHLLSNGRYSVMVTAAGSGYSRWRDAAVTRWREDVTRDQWGSYIYLRDTASGVVWSPAYQPAGREADSYEVVFTEESATYTRRDGSISTALNIVVSAEDDAEIRRVSLSNLGPRAREIELTSYQELVLAPQAADVAHPAFQNLFVQTEFVPELGALLATRRPRSTEDQPIWATHVATIEEHGAAFIQYETDRARFLGRGRSARNPICITEGRPLSNTVGAVLDPIFSLRVRVAIAPGETVHVVFSTAVADTREHALDLADKYRTPATFERAGILAWTQAQVQLHHLGIDAAEAQVFQRLANRILYSDPSLRASANVLLRNDRGAPALWPHGISGDLPIVVVRIDESEDLDIVRQLLRAHEYWGLKLLDVDLVVVNEHGATYAQDLHGSLETLVRTSQSILGHHGHPSHGNVYVLRGDRLTTEDRTLLFSAARAVVLSRRGSLAEQVIRLERAPAVATPAHTPTTSRSPVHDDVAPLPQLEFFNGLGGFDQSGRVYVTVLGPGQSTPAPWLNVIANPSFGFQVSESGSGYTWAENSRENQLTAWSNDPVTDPPGEALYLRDNESGELWSPTAQPIRCPESTYIARHGAGHSRFEVLHSGIQLDLDQFVPLDQSIKISVLTIENRSGRTRRLSMTAYVEWVLGTVRGANGPRIITEHDPQTGAVLARNPWNTDFGGRVAFLDLGGLQQAWTADRTEFIGRNGDLMRPAALGAGGRLQESSGAGIDPCAALQTNFDLVDGAQTEIVVLLGQAGSRDEALELIRTTRETDHWATLQSVQRTWDDIKGTVQVRTPDRSMDILLNGWLVQQALACRVWARSALYQAGGAYGFRDQLQDVIALVIARRDIAREHLLRAAAQQFIEGDVQHWWHPPTGRGVRTHISDDRLWLPYAVDRYVEITGDMSVLDEMIPFLEGPLLRPDQGDAYFQPERSAQHGSLFEHCAAAIDCSLAVGVHGLPLMGTGDWNDGMNRVGASGRGESVWLGWFLHRTLSGFVPIARSRGDHARADRWTEHIEQLRGALERNGWDGDWYRRAYFDDGTPLGSAMNTECRIDSIAQSWSVLSGAAEPARARQAMAAVDQYLVRQGDGLVLLFTPAFDHGLQDPGYIKGYLPGVRENGGQYTHGAIWSVIAFAALGDGDKAVELFSILNPINHASTRAGVYRYKVEPYVMAADVYAEPPHVGRGGWTWYTGAAGWMYQAGLESILGFRLRGTELQLEPCIPTTWPGFEIGFRYHTAHYEIIVENPHGVNAGVVVIEIDGQALADGLPISLRDDGALHRIRVELGDIRDRHRAL